MTTREQMAKAEPNLAAALAEAERKRQDEYANPEAKLYDKELLTVTVGDVRAVLALIRELRCPSP